MSALLLKMSLHYPQLNHSYKDLHVLTERATPEMYYEEWINLNLQQINTSRQKTFITNLQKTYSVGHNKLNNKFYSLNRQIPLEWFNKSLDSFKIACKNKFLKFK